MLTRAVIEAEMTLEFRINLRRARELHASSHLAVKCMRIFMPIVLFNFAQAYFDSPGG